MNLSSNGVAELIFETMADMSKGILSVPELGIYEDIGRNYSLSQEKKEQFSY